MANVTPDFMADPKSLDAKSAYEWRSLSAQVHEHRRTSASVHINMTLEAAIARDPQSPVAGAYRLWIADNYLQNGDIRESLGHYDMACEALSANEPLVASIDGIGGALLHKAQAAARCGDTKASVEAYEALARHHPDDPDPLFQAGLVMEDAGDHNAAATFYGRTPTKTAQRHVHQANFARRNLARLESSESAFAGSPEHVIDMIEAALDSGSGTKLRGVASATHFAIGQCCGESGFEDSVFLDRLCDELGAGKVRVQHPAWGGGDKRYLLTRGWRGRWFRDDVIFVITRSARGWQWTGCAIATPNELWFDHWRPTVKQTNDPLPFELLAPFPDGVCCRAGGMSDFLAQQITISAISGGLPWPLGPAAAAAAAYVLSLRDCGFGVPGFYYGGWETHDNEDYFAIDFTRYQKGLPYINRTNGTPVLAALGGIVSYVADGTPTGSTSANNVVEIQHGDPGDPANTDRFMTRYLHMQGPGKILVSRFMRVFAGNRLALMDDTGKSIGSHLHFSIHDRQLLFPGYTPGRSVRPTPMNGITLEDGDSGKCVCSTNVETFGEKPMIYPTRFAVQNWTITPVATSFGKTPPASSQEQSWQLVLSGVVLIDMKGVSSAQWRRETLLINPDLKEPIKTANRLYGFPLPAGHEDTFRYLFQVEQRAAFASLSSVFNANVSNNSGFAVDAWRPNPDFTVTDTENLQVPNIFSGVQADIAVRDSDAFLYRVGYHITLIGRIVLSPIVIL